MKREDEIRNKAYELGQKYFPNECNIWARANIEAQYVSSACTEMAEWVQKKMIDKACDWIQCMILDYMQGDITDVKWGSMLADFRKDMEE